MSVAYEEWVRVERTRLNYALFIEKGDEKGWPIDGHREEFETLTKENKKRRLLFAKGRKESVGRARKVR